jgi:hypothetical protein
MAKQSFSETLLMLPEIFSPRQVCPLFPCFSHPQSDTNLFLSASGQRNGVPKGILMITDGPSQYKSGDNDVGVVIEWGDLDVKVASVGFGDTFVELQVESVATSDDYLALLPDYNLDQLEANHLVKLLCPGTASPTVAPSEYPTTLPTGKPSSFHPTRFPTFPDQTASPTKSPTTVPSPMPEHCASVMDVMFVVDSTSSIGAFNFDKMTSYVAQ